MNRREFLTSASSAALISAMPLKPVIDLPVSIETAPVIITGDYETFSRELLVKIADAMRLEYDMIVGDFP